ncbi:MAG: sigma-70 family RNA polymerase sigma factor [bacterium]
MKPNMKLNTDEGEYRQLLEKYEPLIREIASDYYAPGGDYDDLLQEGRLALVRADKSYDEDHEVPFPAYAALCIRRGLQDYIRARRRKKHQVLNDARRFEEEGELEVASSTDHPEWELLAREAFSTLRSLIRNSLSSLEKEVLDGYLQGRTYAEMARELDKDEKAIDNALDRCRRKLARQLKQLKISSRAIFREKS